MRDPEESTVSVLSLKAVSEAEHFAPSALQSVQGQEGVSPLDVQWRFWTEWMGKGWDEERGLPAWRCTKKQKIGYVSYDTQETQKSAEKGLSGVFTKRSWFCFFNKNAGLA